MKWHNNRAIIVSVHVLLFNTQCILPYVREHYMLVVSVESGLSATMEEELNSSSESILCPLLLVYFNSNKMPMYVQLNYIRRSKCFDRAWK